MSPLTQSGTALSLLRNRHIFGWAGKLPRNECKRLGHLQTVVVLNLSCGEAKCCIIADLERRPLT